MAETVRQVYDAAGLQAAIGELAEQLRADFGGRQDVALVGIRTRGAVLAERLARLVKFALPLGILDIGLYRDDYDLRGVQPQVKSTELPFDVNNKTIILVDDVLFTGRTVRAALAVLTDFGRPEAVRLLTLVDRGGRELPIQADYVAFRTQVSADQMVSLHLQEVDGCDEVVITR